MCFVAVHTDHEGFPTVAKRLHHVFIIGVFFLPWTLSVTLRAWVIFLAKETSTTKFTHSVNAPIALPSTEQGAKLCSICLCFWPLALSCLKSGRTCNSGC